MGSDLISILHKQDNEQKKKFWIALIEECVLKDVECPVTANAPEESVHIGTLPSFLRGPFLQAYIFRRDDRLAEAELWEDAVSGLTLEHFKKQLAKHKKLKDHSIGEFLVSKDWNIYAMPLPHN